MTSDWQEGIAKAAAALKQTAQDKTMQECAQLSPLVRTHMLKKGDVLLLNTKFRELDKNGDRKIQWHEFEQGRSALPTSIQVLRKACRAFILPCSDCRRDCHRTGL